MKDWDKAENDSDPDERIDVGSESDGGDEGW